MRSSGQAPTPTPSATARWSGAISGVLSAGLAMAVAEVLAAALVRGGHTGGTPSPVLAVGGAFVDLTPGWLKDFAVSTFGTNDKAALFVAMALVLLAFSAAVGILATRDRRLGLLGVVLLGAVGSVAVLTRPHAGAADVLPVLVGTGAGLWMLDALAGRGVQATRTGSDIDRRQFVRLAGITAAIALGGAALSQLVQRSSRAVAASRAAVRLPKAENRADAATGVALAVPGITPYVTAPDEFYRIDTALSVPQVTTKDWRLRVHGMVKNPIEISFDDLLGLPMIDTMLTLACVSNEVGGNLIGNQRWQGHPLRELLARAVPSPDADMVLSTSSDGWTAGTPIDTLTDPDRDALLAIGMGGAPLPVEHGFPVRMVVPGLYGYVSATKWVIDLEVTRFDRAQGYWTPRGWAAQGPVKTESRIDVPRLGESIDAGMVAVAGVAWAQHRGIDKVEVRVDQGPWQTAELGESGNKDTWRQWVWRWDAAPGDHTMQVRATDGTGEVQTATQAPPAPDGASGWHTVQVKVR